MTADEVNALLLGEVINYLVQMLAERETTDCDNSRGDR